MKKLLSIAMIFTMAFVFWSCKKDDGPAEISGRVTFVQGDVLLSGEPCSFGDIVKEGDTIVTGEMSLAVIQFGDISVINLKSNTELIIASLVSERDGERVELEQRRGSTFNKIVKSGVDYSVNTPTAVAAVRGTSFSFDVTEAGSALRLSTGHVRVVPVIKGRKAEEDAVEVSAGNRIETSEEGAKAPEPLTAGELKELEALDKIALIEDIDKPETIERIKESPEEERPLIIPVEVIEVIREVKREDDVRLKPEKRITLRDIQARYGSLSVITTAGGESYTGAFVQEGDLVSVFTTEGTVEIDASEIESVTRYRGTVR